jgi:dTDP-4-dehydrorhamnose reductase
MKILIIGASGLLGRHCFVEAKRRGHRVMGTYRQHPLPDLVAIDADEVTKFKPDAVLFAAGYTHVDGCETHPQRAKRDNIYLPAKWAMEGIPFLYFSTSYVFDGSQETYTESDPPHPLNFYGATKREGEEAVQCVMNGGETIIRTMGVFGIERSRKNFVCQVIDRLSMGESMAVPDDQFGNATFAPDLARIALDLLGSSGCFHVAGPDPMLQRSQLAVTIAQKCGLDPSLIIPTPTADLNQKAPRPRYAGLVTNKKPPAMRGLSEIDFRQFCY